MKKPYFIVIEGLDGSGKSTIVNHLAKICGADKLSTPLKNLQGNVREKIEDAYKGSPLARKLFYCSTVVKASEEVNKRLNKGISVIMDRYWLSTMVYHQFLGEHSILEEVEKQLAVPDYTFFINVSREIRKQRIQERGIALDHDLVTLNPTTNQKLIQTYSDMKDRTSVGRFVQIEADHKPVKSITKKITSTLNK